MKLLELSGHYKNWVWIYDCQMYHTGCGVWVSIGRLINTSTEYQKYRRRVTGKDEGKLRQICIHRKTHFILCKFQLVLKLILSVKNWSSGRSRWRKIESGRDNKKEVALSLRKRFYDDRSQPRVWIFCEHVGRIWGPWLNEVGVGGLDNGVSYFFSQKEREGVQVVMCFKVPVKKRIRKQFFLKQ